MASRTVVLTIVVKIPEDGMTQPPELKRTLEVALTNCLDIESSSVTMEEQR